MKISKEGFRLIYEVSKVESVSLKNTFKTDSGSVLPPRVKFRTSLLAQEEKELGLTDTEYNLDITVECASPEEVKTLGELLRKVEYSKENISFPALLPVQDGYTDNYKVRSLINGTEFIKLNSHILNSQPEIKNQTKDPAK